MNAEAQELRYVPTDAPASTKLNVDKSVLRNALRTPKAARKTTGPGGSAWYNYGEAMDTSRNYQKVTVEAGDPATLNTWTGLSATTIWNDTNGTALYTGGVYSHITDVCQAAVLDPFAAILNTDPDQAYVGRIRITKTTPYTWDSVALYGLYTYNTAKASVVDTLRLVFLTGAGGAPASDDIFSGYSLAGGGHYGTATFFDMRWDSTGKNTATNRTWSSTHTDVILATRSDTLSNGLWLKTVSTGGISVPAGSYCGMSVTFISGDPATKGAGQLASPTPGDTLIGYYKGVGANKYNIWRPLANAYEDGSNNNEWAPYQTWTYEPVWEDNNLGYWKRLPNTNWNNVFLPTWAWSVGAGPSARQYPYMAWHLTCPTCDLITPAYLGNNNTITALNAVTATPNPANNKVSINFSFDNASDVTVTLTNLLGQVVASQNLSNMTSGSAVFNTSALASGVYVYTMQANGESTTGRIVVAH